MTDVLYVESVKDYVHVHMANDKLILKYSISAFEELLDSRFVRVHRSYLVNKDKVTAFTKTDIEISIYLFIFIIFLVKKTENFYEILA